MQKPPPFVLTEAVHTTALAPGNMPINPGTSPIIPDSGMFGAPVNVVVNSQEYLANKSSIERAFQNQVHQLAKSIEHDLAATRLQLPTYPLPPAQAIIRELGIRKTLMNRKTAELNQKIASAQQFFGESPLNKSFHDYYKKARGNHREVDPRGIAMSAWASSYRAAHEAILLAQSLQMLNQQQVEVHKWLAAVQGRDQAQAAAAENARQAAEQARIAAQQQRHNEIAEAARREQQAISAREQARLEALVLAQQQAAEQARTAAEAAARQIAAEQTRLEELAEHQRQREAERLRVEQQIPQRADETRIEQQQKAQRSAKRKRQQQARRKARAEAALHVEQTRLKDRWQAQTEERWQKPVFAHSGSMAAFGPAFAGTLGTLSISPATALALRTSLRSAVTVATAAISTAAAPVLVGFAALLLPSELGSGDLYAASVPLSDLAPDLEADLYEAAAIGGEVDLPVRLGARTVGNRVDIVVVSTDGVSVPGHVSVRLARFDAQKKVYVSAAAGTDSRGPTVTWTPLVEPLNPSTDLPFADTDLSIYEGAHVTPDSGRIDIHPPVDEYGFGGWITVFPIDAGIPPIFTLFRDRRQDAGIASGTGQAVSGDWIGAASTVEEAPIPRQVADKLRGREFSGFKAFRRTFWKTVAAEAGLFELFNRIDRSSLRHGLSPKPHQSEHVGNRRKYELHHVIPIELGGAVYDMDNLRLLTPRKHIDIHRSARGTGE